MDMGIIKIMDMELVQIGDLRKREKKNWEKLNEYDI